jgi:predicted aspartyl protease
MEFKYKKIGDEYFSVIPLVLRKNANRVPVAALIDTGASYSVFKSRIGEELGINIPSGEERALTIGDGNKITIYLHDGGFCIIQNRLIHKELDLFLNADSLYIRVVKNKSS